ncbi:hypothetical protein [Streptomyces decoyicus]
MRQGAAARPLPVRCPLLLRCRCPLWLLPSLVVLLVVVAAVTR